jgi:arylsulfatase A-like enzyme
LEEGLGKDWIEKNRTFLMQPYSQGVFKKLHELAQTWKQEVALSKVGSDALYRLVESFDEYQLQYFLALLDSAIYKADNDIIGELVRQLKDTDLLDKTIIIITADHGNEYKEHGNFFHCAWLYDEVMKVPLVIYLPKLRKPAVINELAQGIDILPTTLDLLGINIPHQAQGISLVGVIEGRKNALRNDFVYCHGVPAGTIAIRSNDWK